MEHHPCWIRPLPSTCIGRPNYSYTTACGICTAADGANQRYTHFHTTTDMFMQVLSDFIYTSYK